MGVKLGLKVNLATLFFIFHDDKTGYCIVCALILTEMIIFPLIL